ncbi:MAG: lectin-like protein [Candidatus Poribacteria bacterium]|nr:lectin-like protein [Candidatus Poribacteria bacterium]
MKRSDFIQRLVDAQLINPFIGIVLFFVIAVCLFSGCSDLRQPVLSAVSHDRTQDGTVGFSGRVVGLEGESIAGLSLAIQHVMFDDYTDEAEWIQPLETETDEDGAFSFSGITPGQVQLILPFDIDTEKQFYVEPEDEILSIKIGEVTYHQDEPYAFGGITFTITPGVHIQNVEVKVRPRMRIRGRLVFNDGSPLADARIRISMRQEDLDGSGGGSSSGGTQTDADGTFTEYVSGGGLYTVTVAYQDLSVTSEQFVLNAGERREDLLLMFDSAPIAPVAEDVETSTPPAFDRRGVWVVNPENGHAYKEVYVEGPEEAKALATAENAYLVSINDEMEQRWLEGLFDPAPFWIGLSDVETEGEWQWDSGEPVTYTNWSPNEIFPDDLDDAEKDYVVKIFTGEWQAVGTESPFWRITRRAILEADELPAGALTAE